MLPMALLMLCRPAVLLEPELDSSTAMFNAAERPVERPVQASMNGGVSGTATPPPGLASGATANPLPTTDYMATLQVGGAISTHKNFAA